MLCAVMMTEIFRNHRRVLGLRALLSAIFAFFLSASLALSCESDYPIWIPRSSSADPLYRFVKLNAGKKYRVVGYIDQAGNVVIPPILHNWGGNNDGEFHDGLLEIGVDDGIYVNSRGKRVIKKKLYRGWDFSEGLAVAMAKEGGKWGYINLKGEFAIKPEFSSSPTDYVWPFEDGFAMIEVKGKFGYIDHLGKFVIPMRFLDGDSFHEGMARVIAEGPCTYSRIEDESPYGDFGVLPRGTEYQKSLPSCKYTFVDKFGRIISEQRYSYARPFSEGFAPVRVGELWGYIDKKGTMVISPRFDNATPFSSGLALVSENHLFGYIDHSGSYAIKPQFKYAESFADGLAVVGGPESDYLYITQSGRQAFPGLFIYASSFFKGLAHVKLQGSPALEESAGDVFAYIDATGRIVFTYKP